MITTIIFSLFACVPEIKSVEEERFIENPAFDYDQDGYTENQGDCDDRNPDVYPNGSETCDGFDNDCNGVVDDNPEDIQTYYLDSDGDGFGSETESELACPADKSDGYIEEKFRDGQVVFDCDDLDPEMNPDEAEICDDMDNDCDGDVDEEDSEQINRWYVDEDEDGFGVYLDEDSVFYSCREVPGLSPNFLDCDDTNAEIFPNADEYCDGVDNNCDSVVDEGTAVDSILWIEDADLDGYGTNFVTRRSCSQPEGFLNEESGGDCNDDDPSINPNATESCNSADDNCNGYVDEGSNTTAPIGSSTFYTDADGDSFGDSNSTLIQCTAASGYVSNADDCDDSDPTLHPNTTWYLDSDGDGNGNPSQTTMQCAMPSDHVDNSDDCNDSDASLNENDVDGDGFSSCQGDCDDSSASLNLDDSDGDGFSTCAGDCDDDPSTGVTVYPFAPESCNSIDDNCDGSIDEGSDSTAPSGSTTWYADSDGDGDGDALETLTQCTMPSTHVANTDDCDDGDDTLNADDADSDGYSTCDDDCDDNDASANLSDADSDGMDSCSGDCNDNDSSIYLNATESCNSIDDDCDGGIDENDAIDKTAYYEDADGDGFGDATSIEYTCPLNQPSGFVDNLDDCDDTLSDVYPNALEYCNQIDDNCNGGVDEGTDFNAPPDALTWFYDLDGDGYGNLNNIILACASVVGTVSNSDDCNDSRAASRPGAAEYCNELDDDCDGAVDEDAIDRYAYYLDADGDGHGDASTQVLECPDSSTGLPNPPPFTSDDGDDCDDANADISPSAAEQCTPLIDENCDGDSTYGVVSTDLPSWYPDSDGDGYGNPSFVIQLCEQPLNYIDNADDCNDTDFYVHPEDQVLHASEFEDDGVTTYIHRERCNGQVDLCENDWNADLSPPADEWDDDSDGFIECEIDSSFLFNSDGTVNLWNNNQVVFSGVDCDDTNADRYPFAEEICNGIFERCNDPNYSEIVAPSLEDDGDGDGYVECEGFDSSIWLGGPNVIGGGDCNDGSVITFPGGAPLTDATACLTDADGDGYSDRLWSLCPAEQTLSEARVQFIGENSSDYSGYSVSSAGDVDGDGLDDVLIGAYRNNDGGSNAGKSYLIFGSSLGSNSTIDLSLADYSFIGENTNDYSGVSVSSAGDVDGDGLDDLLIGAYSNPDGGGIAGKTYLILGSSLGSNSTIYLSAADYSFIGENASDRSGVSVFSAGDIDGDGLDDLLIGAPHNDDGGTNAGKTYLILASSLGSSSTIDLSTADYSFIGENTNDYSGVSVSSAGDVDGDGLDDLLIGAYNNYDGGSNAGKSYLIFGSSLGSNSTIDLSTADYSFIGENVGNYSGYSVSSAGDVDGDGLDDVLIGAFYNSDGGNIAGKSYLILGSSLGSSSTIDLSTADHSFIGENAGDESGTSVSSAGDIDGDGLDDVLIGAYLNDDGGSNAGKVALFSACEN